MSWKYINRKFGKHYYEPLGEPTTSKTQAGKWVINAEKHGYYTRIIKKRKGTKPIYHVYVRRKMSLNKKGKLR